jgi:holo-[acyl-carrier protein] synthase
MGGGRRGENTEHETRNMKRVAMKIVGHGVDLVEVGRIGRMRGEHGSHFLDRVFTRAEQAYCLSHQRAGGADVRFAGRFAVKEAILKVLGTGWRGQNAWTDLEMWNAATGKPEVTLTGESKRIAEGLGIVEWHVSISHTETHAVGSAIGCGGGS